MWSRVGVGVRNRGQWVRGWKRNFGAQLWSATWERNLGAQLGSATWEGSEGSEVFCLFGEKRRPALAIVAHSMEPDDGCDCVSLLWFDHQRWLPLLLVPSRAIAPPLQAARLRLAPTPRPPAQEAPAAETAGLLLERLPLGFRLVLRRHQNPAKGAEHGNKEDAHAGNNLDPSSIRNDEKEVAAYSTIYKGSPN